MPSGATAPPMLQCLVTPKLTFNLSRKSDWKTVDDISQDELRSAFMSRFPVPLRLEDFTFRPAVPESTEISPETEQLVYKITAKDVADDRVMLRLLQELEKAYGEKQMKTLDEAKADMMASQMTFQVVVDELRQIQKADSEAVQKELGKIRGQFQQSQKRLFLLEQEKQQMGTKLKSLEADNRKLRQLVSHIAEESEALQTRSQAIETTMRSLEAQFSDVVPPLPLPPPLPAPRISPSWVTLSEEEERIAELEKHNHAMSDQLDALGAWLKAGATIFRVGDSASGPFPGAGLESRPHPAAALLACVQNAVEDTPPLGPQATEYVPSLDPLLVLGVASSEDEEP